MDSNIAEKIFKAYRAGLLSRRPSLRGQNQKFDVLFRQVFWLKVPLRERLRIRKIWELSSAGLRLSREHRLDEAAEAFLACWEEHARADISPQSSLLAKTFAESCNAYFEHKRGAFALARARTYSSMEADLELESDIDFSLLELHRIQSANNLMRIDLRSGEQCRALSLAGEILSYLEGCCEEITVHRLWRSDLLRDRTPRTIRRALIAQVANEAALAFSEFPGLGLEDKLLATAEWQKALTRRTHLTHSQLWLWLAAKQAHLKKSWDEYFEGMVEFLPTGRTDIEPIWYSAVIDFLGVCRELRSHVSMYVHEAILRDARKWPGVPISLRSALGLNSSAIGESHSKLQAAGFRDSRSAAA